MKVTYNDGNTTKKRSNQSTSHELCVEISDYTDVTSEEAK